jgi:threonine/homoserine/homoserine lactone efflux protein
MIAGPQIITPFFLAMSENWKKNSAAFLGGALLAVTFFVTLAYVVVKVLHHSVGDHESGANKGITVAILILLILGAFNTFRTRKTAKPPEWMGKLETATPKKSFRLGFLLLGLFPGDIITSTVVGSHLARDGGPWWYCLPFVFLTLFFEAVPALMVLLLGKRAEVVLPKVRDWMTSNSWIISEVVIGLFIAIEIKSLAGS